MFYFIGKKTYKLKFSKKSKIYNGFYILFIKKKTIRKRQINNNDIRELNANITIIVKSIM